MKKQTTIWKSYGMYTRTELEEAKKDTKEFLKELYPDIELTDENIGAQLEEDIHGFFKDELENLNMELDGRILAIADVGTWQGRRQGCKILGHNLNGVLASGIGCDEKEVYVGTYGVYAEGYHHDGSNFVEFREIKEDTNYDLLLDKLYKGIATRSDIRRYTKSLRPYVQKIYGI